MIDFEPSIDSSSSLQNHFFFSKSLLPQVQNILETVASFSKKWY